VYASPTLTGAFVIVGGVEGLACAPTTPEPAVRLIGPAGAANNDERNQAEPRRHASWCVGIHGSLGTDKLRAKTHPYVDVSGESGDVLRRSATEAHVR